MSWFLSALGVIVIIGVALALVLIAAFVMSVFKSAREPWPPPTPAQLEAAHFTRRLRAIYREIEFAQAQQDGDWDVLRAADIAGLKAEAASLQVQLARLGYNK